MEDLMRLKYSRISAVEKYIISTFNDAVMDDYDDYIDYVVHNKTFLVYEKKSATVITTYIFMSRFKIICDLKMSQLLLIIKHFFEKTFKLSVKLII